MLSEPYAIKSKHVPCHIFKDKCSIQLQNPIWYLRFCKKGSENIKRRKGSCFTAEIGTCFSFDLSRNFGKNVEERERERLIHCARLHYIVHSSFGNVVVISSFLKEWRDWCAIHLQRRMNNFLSNKYCTQLSLVLIAHNQSVQYSKIWKCTVSVFAPIPIIQFIKRKLINRAHNFYNRIFISLFILYSNIHYLFSHASLQTWSLEPSDFLNSFPVTPFLAI